MPPRLHMRSLEQLAELPMRRNAYICHRCQYATATATTPAPSEAHLAALIPHISRYPPTQPPSHRRPEYRKSQNLRAYVSLLQTTPLMILFQHNNLKAMEWVGIRRELSRALQKVDEQLITSGRADAALGSAIKLQVIQTNIFEPALRIAEYYKPDLLQQPPPTMVSEKEDPSLTHALSESAYLFVQDKRNIHPMTTLLSGPIALLNFPAVSPQHVKAALSILSPKAPTFAAPTRRANPTYYDPPVQDGLKKLMLLGARVDGRVFDMDGTRWVGGIDGGIDGLRAQLVGMLQGFGAGLTGTLEAAGRSLWVTMEGRRRDLEVEIKQEEKKKDI